LTASSPAATTTRAIRSGWTAAGWRLFDELGSQHTELELTRTLHGLGVTHLRYRVLTAGSGGPF
jgi:hypothetical protein